MANLVTSRTFYFDEPLNKSFKINSQFVVMGLGLDTRCYGSIAENDITLFELDKKESQGLKIRCLNQVKTETSKVHFIKADFTNENWSEQLYKAGYDKNKKITFLWEGVSLYLSKKVIRNTLKEIKQNTASGSIIIADFYANKFVNGDLIPVKKKSFKILQKTNEELGFRIAFEGNYSKELEALFNIGEITLGKVFYVGHKTKTSTWVAVVELKI